MHSDSNLIVLALDELIDDRIEEDTTNTDTTAKELHGVQAFAKNKSNADNNDHTLGGVGNGLSNRRGLLQGHGRKLIVAVVPKSGGNQIHLDSRGGLKDVHKLTPSTALLKDDKGNGKEESKDAGKGKLIANRSHPILQALGLHELLILVPSDGSKKIGNASRYQGGNRKVKLVHRCKNNATNDDGEAQPLGLGDLLSINELRQHRGKGGLGRLYNLTKGNTTSREGEHRRTVGTGVTECKRKHFDNVVHGHLGGLPGVGGDPKEESVQTSNSQLKGGDSHRETSSSASSLEGTLIRKVVKVVAHIPKDKVDKEGNVERSKTSTAASL